MELTVSDIQQAAALHLMGLYGRHQAPQIWEAIHGALAAHDATTAALAATFATRPAIEEIAA